MFFYKTEIVVVIHIFYTELNKLVTHFDLRTFDRMVALPWTA